MLYLPATAAPVRSHSRPRRLVLLRAQAHVVEVTVTTKKGKKLSTTLSTILPLGVVSTVSLSQPLGIAFAENQGKIVVDELYLGGHAESSGAVKVGDCLRAATMIMKDLSGNGEEVLFRVDGEDLDMVEAIIHSHTRSKTSISLVLERPHPYHILA